MHYGTAIFLSFTSLFYFSIREGSLPTETEAIKIQKEALKYGKYHLKLTEEQQRVEFSEPTLPQSIKALNPLSVHVNEHG